MAITREQTAADTVNGDTDITVAYDSTPTEGSLLVVQVNGGSAMDATPSGWTEDAIDSSGKTAIYSKIAGASEGNSYTWTMPSSDQATWAAAEYSSPNGMQIAAEWTSAATSTSSVTSKSTGTTAYQTTDGAACVGVAGVVMSNGAAVSGESWTNSYTQRENVIVEAGQAWSMEGMLADRLFSGGAAAETTITWTGARDYVKSVLAVYREISANVPTIRKLTDDVDATGSNNPYTTATFQPNADATILLGVTTRDNDGTDRPPVVTGGSLTWTSVVEIQHDTSGVLSYLQVFRAETGSSPSAFGITLTYPNDPVGTHWHVYEILNSDLSGSDNGVEQNATDLDAAGATSVTTVFSSAPASSSAVLQFNSIQASTETTFTAETDFTTGSEQDVSEAEQSAVQIIEGSSPTSIDGTWGQSGPIGAIAVEVRSGLGSDATATPASLAATGTFPAVTPSAGAASSPGDLAATATFNAISLKAGAGPEPSVLDAFAGFPSVTAIATQNATSTLNDLVATGTFPTVVTVAINGEVAPATILEVVGGFPVVVATGVVNGQAVPNTLVGSSTFPVALGLGQESDSVSTVALGATSSFPSATTTATNSEDVATTALSGSATFPFVEAAARSLSHFFNSDVGLAIEVAFDDYPLVGSPTWTNITGDVRSFTISRGRKSELDEYKAGVATFLVDANQGDYDPTNDSSPYYPNVIPMKQVRVRASYGSSTYTIFRGFIERWPMQIKGYTDEIVTLRAVDGTKLLQANKDSSAQGQENSATRVGNLLDEAGWPSALRTLGTGAITVPAFTPECSTTLQLIRQIKDSEGGQFYIDRSGNAVFRNRTYRSGLSSQATFGDSSGQIPYQDIKFDYDDSQIWNRVEVFIGGFPSFSSSTASQDQFGIRQLTINDIQLPNSTDGNDLADVYVDRYKDPKERIESISFLPEADPSGLWPEVLGRNLSDKITVVYHTNAGQPKTLASYIESVSHKVSLKGRWKTTWSLSQYL